MVSEARRLIFIGFIAVLISVSGWSVHATVQASEDGLVRTEFQNIGRTEVDISDIICRGVVAKYPKPSQDQKYVEYSTIPLK